MFFIFIDEKLEIFYKVSDLDFPFFFSFPEGKVNL